MEHLKSEQRYEIEALLQKNHTQKEITEYLGKSEATISREIRRNCDQRSGKYRAELAMRKCADRHKNKRKKIRFTEAIKQEVINLLSKDYSPEQIVGTMKLAGKETISHERIYQFVWQDKKQGGKLHKHFRTKGKRYRKRGDLKDKRGIIAGKKNISERPKIVEERTRVGDFEVDLVIGKNHKQAILTMNDRASGYTFIRLLQSKKSEDVKCAIIEISIENQLIIHTLTSDNGKEFFRHKEVSEALNLDYYFANPYHSWERGSNENYNGLLRQYFPKDKDFSQITQADLDVVQDKLNNRPRKRFGFLSPKQVYLQLINSD